MVRKRIPRLPMLLLAIGGSLLTPGCRAAPGAAAPTPAASFGTGEIRIVSSAETFVLPVEVAETPRQLRVGLQRRAELPEHAGMVFLFEEEQPRGTAFWMYRTPVPLSIAFLDAGWVIREIRDMEPCRSWIALFCPTHEAGVPFRAALEVNRGYFERRGIGPGDRVIFRRLP